MKSSVIRSSALLLFSWATLFAAGCATTGGAYEDAEPTVVDPVPEVTDEAEEPIPEPAPAADNESKEKEGELPIAVADSEPAEAPIPEVVVQSHIPLRHEAIFDLVTEARNLLRDVELKYVLTGKGKRQALRGRPVAFALWSEIKADLDHRPTGTAASAAQVETRQEATAHSFSHARHRGRGT
jgi:hypothetical protein